MIPANKSSLILRLWRDEQTDGHTWRASVEIPETSRRIGFASLEHLFAFLLDFCELNCDLKFTQDKPVEETNES